MSSTAKGTGLRQLTTNDRVDQDPVVLPDGRVIYSSQVSDTDVDLFEIGIDAGPGQPDGEPLLARPGVDIVPAG